jgi:aminoglycoside 3'-phosphotransferase I
VKLPSSLHPVTSDYTVARAAAGESGAIVYRLSRKGRRTLFLKYGSGRIASAILDELVRLQWLNQRLPSPRVLQFGGDRTSAWMLTTALPGRSAEEWLASNPETRSALVRAIAEFLRRLHSLPPESCPFQSDHRLRMIEARRNIEAGLVDESDFDERRLGWTAGRVWTELQTLVPARFHRVVTHGDFSLGNIFVNRGRVTGVIDVGRLGIADPYQDLAILWHNLAEFGPGLQQTLLNAYGMPRPGKRKLDFHLCLDELF